MASIVVQLGQCGNQIGTQLFSILHSDASNSKSGFPSSAYYQKTIDRYFREREGGRPPLARAILLDMEPKVIECSLSDARQEGTWLYDPSSVYKGNRGSGNNWANGFYCHGPESRQVVLDIVRREVEMCDHLEGFVVLMSVAGGTGSGLGAFITNALREEYPSANIVNPIVWPYASGEVIVQNYNALLTSSHLYESTDALVMFLNDHLHRVCSQLLQLKDISFKDLNKVAGHALASVLQPATPYESFSTHARDFNYFSRYCSLSDLCASLTPQPNFRFLSIKCFPQMPDRSHAFTNYLWAGLLKYLRQMVATDSPVEDGMDWTSRKVNKCLANLLVPRGRDLSPSDLDVFSRDETFYVDWVPASMRHSVWHSPHPFNRYEKSCSVVSNGQSCIRPLNSVVDKAWKMYSAKAYVHQYSQFGLSEDGFMESFVKVEQVLKNYSMLV